MLPRQTISAQVSATPVIVDVRNMGTPFTIAVYPGAADTTKVEFSTSPSAVDNPAAANWQVVTGLSAVVAATPAYATMTGGCVALRLTRSAGASTDTIEVCS